MATKSTFKNIARVTENYDGSFIAPGWYAFRFATTTTPRDEFGGTGYEEHIGVEYLMHERDMDEQVDYVDYVGDYSCCVAEYVGSKVERIHFGADDDIEDCYIAETMAGIDWNEMGNPPEDEREDICRTFYEDNCVEVDHDGKLMNSILASENLEVTFGTWDAC